MIRDSTVAGHEWPSYELFESGLILKGSFMEEGKNICELKDTTANPAPLGLLGFGMTTVLLNLHNAGFYGLNSMILAMGICYGGLAQIIAGIMEWKKKNTFGTVAFCSYGLFWLSLVALIVLPKTGWADKTSSNAMGAYLFMWGLFTLVMFIGTLKLNKALQFVFFTLALLFFLLAVADWLNNESIKLVAGWEGIVCGFSAIYAGLAQVLNECYGKTVLPLGPVK
jgi:succinate-acetate transporter protein